MITTEVDSRKRLRDSIRSQIQRIWRSQGRFDFSQTEIELEVDRQLENRQRRSANSPQLQFDFEPMQQLQLIDCGLVARETKRQACLATRQVRIGRRERIVRLLELAGANGLTRAEIARALQVEQSSVSQPVKYLIDTDQASEPFSRVGQAGHKQAVVVLANFLGVANGRTA